MNVLYDHFKLEWAESGSNETLQGLRIFIQNLMAIFPETKRVRKRSEDKWLTLYRGISIKTLPPIDSKCSFQEITKFLTPFFKVVTENENVIECSMDSGCLSNGNPIVKKLNFYANGTLDVNVFMKTLNVKIVQLNNTFTFDEHSIQSVCSAISTLKVCEGILVKKKH